MIAAIIIGLRVKKETIGEIAAAAQVMRELATKVVVTDPTNLVDTCGTGGDGAHTFNISTAASFVAAAAGAHVAKHGGPLGRPAVRQRRRARGARRQHQPHARAGRALPSTKLGVGFMFAPSASQRDEARGAGAHASSACAPSSTSSAR